MAKDDIFLNKKNAEDFNFGKETARVFDDMLDRSVPFYQEVQRMIGEMCADFAVPGTNVYDIGCSTCNTFLQIESKLPDGVTCVGVDSSEEMLQKAAEKLTKSGFSKEYQLVHSDINKGIVIENASIVVLNLTLQFVRPLHRERIIRAITQGLNPGGCLILVEKVLCQNSTLNRFFIKYYYELKKRNGYSEMEISQKREALENVLIPYHFDENKELLLNNGFKACDTFFRWYNFCGIVALK